MSGTFLSEPIKKFSGQGAQGMSVSVNIACVLGTGVLSFVVLCLCRCCWGMPCLLTAITSLTICSADFIRSCVVAECACHQHVPSLYVVLPHGTCTPLCTSKPADVLVWEAKRKHFLSLRNDASL